MKKFLLVLVFLVSGAAGIIPYWTGIFAEQQFEQFNQSISPGVNLKLLESHYKRGWFNSQARAVFATHQAGAEEQHVIFVHQVDHGLLPVRATQVHTTVATDIPLIHAGLSDTAKETELLESHTMLQGNGDIVGNVRVPALVFSDVNNQVQLQWQESQGQVLVKPKEGGVSTVLQVPQVQLETGRGQLLAQQVGLTVQLQQEGMAGNGQLTVAEIRLGDRQPLLIHLQGVKVNGNHQVESENLRVALQIAMQRVQVGSDYFGPGYGELELRHLDTESLGKIIYTLVESHRQNWSPAYFKVVMLGTLMQQGVTFLNKVPELAITRLSWETPAGKLQGTFQVKVAEFDARNLFHPWLWLTAQLEMQLPEAILFNLTKAWLEWFATEAEVVTPDSIKQHIQTWLTQGILVKAEAGYYSISMQLNKGILHTHGQSLPIASWF